MRFADIIIAHCPICRKKVEKSQVMTLVTGTICIGVACHGETDTYTIGLQEFTDRKGDPLYLKPFV